MMEKEARTNKAGADLDKRNRNWQKIDTHLADYVQQISDIMSLISDVTNIADLRARGYFRDKKSGLILQWGDIGIPAGVGYATATYAIAFPSVALKVFATPNYVSDDVDSMKTIMTPQIGQGSNNKISAVIYARTLTGSIPAAYKQANWFAIGY